MKQQTFDLFSSKEEINTELDLNIDTGDLSSVDSTLKIVPNQTAELEEVDLAEQFDTISFDEEFADIQEINIKKDAQIAPTNDDLETINDVSEKTETIEIDFNTFDGNDIEEVDEVPKTVKLNQGDFQTLDTTQFSIELGEMAVDEDNDEIEEIKIDVVPDENEVEEFGELKIMAIGAGGYGSNVISHVCETAPTSIHTIAIDTDSNALVNSKADETILIGEKLLRGNGSGSDQRKVIEAIHEKEGQIRELLKGYHIVFLTASLAGTTGYNVIAEIGRISKDMGILTIGFVMAPLRQQAKSEAIQQIYNELVNILDSTILVDAEIILNSYGNLSPNLVEEKVDNVLVDGIKGVYELATKTGLINLDYADICTAFRDRGAALLSIATGEGENNLVDAISKAINPKIIDNTILDNAEMAIIGVSAPRKTVTIKQASEASLLVSNMNKNKEKLVLFGWTIDDSLIDKVQATVIISSSGYQTIKDIQQKQQDFFGTDLDEFFNDINLGDDVINPLDLTNGDKITKPDKFSAFDSEPSFSFTEEKVKKDNDFPDFFE